MKVNCKICETKQVKIFDGKILNKYVTKYFQCPKCGFVQTENPYWLHEAYKNAISVFDTGLVSRNLHFSKLSEELIKNNFDYNKRFLDYGGGYGLFVRLMRDKGLEFYRQDDYCQNIFAQYFDINDLKNKDAKFELLTAFEVFEHFENPMTEIKKMLKLSDSILFSTELQPENIKDHKDWWYFAPESGQHISFYTKNALLEIAKNFNLNLYTNNKTLHLLTTKKISPSPFENEKIGLLYKIRRKLSKLIYQKKRLVRLETFTQKDSDFIKNKLK